MGTEFSQSPTTHSHVSQLASLLRQAWSSQAIRLVVSGLLIASAGYLTLRWAPNSFFYMDDYNAIQSTKPLLRLAIEPYEGHLAYVSGVVWATFFRIFGTSSYTPYLWLAICCTSAAAIATSIVVSKIVGRLVGIAALLWVLFLAGAHHNHLWDQASLNQIVPVLFAIAVLIKSDWRFRSPALAALTVVTLGMGGIGFGLAVSISMLLAVARRWKWVAANVGMIVIAMYVATRNLYETPAATGKSGIEKISEIPSYLVVAIQVTIKTALNVPLAYAGALSVALLALSIAVTPFVLRNKPSIASTTMLAGWTYLLTNWASTSWTRGEPEAAAAPRYLGVTGPILLMIAMASVAIGIDIARGHGIILTPTSRPAFRSLVGAFLLLLSTVSQFSMWHDSRVGWSTLGSLNLARLSAMHAGESWIDPGFAPTGEGLTYVRQSPIEWGWTRHGVPELDPQSITTRLAKEASSDAFIATAMEAGLLALSTSTTFPSEISTQPCSHSIEVDSDSIHSIDYWGPAGTIYGQLLDSSSIALTNSSLDGRLVLRELRNAGNWRITSPTKCLALGR
jgi:hypothetical protein